MQSASKLLSAAFAVVAIAATVLPSAQTAEAANGPDVQVKIWNVQGLARDRVVVTGTIKNIGTVSSAPILVTTFCGYWLDKDGVKEVAAEPIQVKPGLTPGHDFDTDFECGPWNGHMPIFYRLVAVSDGDVNKSNNDVRRLAF